MKCFSLEKRHTHIFFPMNKFVVFVVALLLLSPPKRNRKRECLCRLAFSNLFKHDLCNRRWPGWEIQAKKNVCCHRLLLIASYFKESEEESEKKELTRKTVMITYISFTSFRYFRICHATFSIFAAFDEQSVECRDSSHKNQ